MKNLIVTLVVVFKELLSLSSTSKVVKMNCVSTGQELEGHASGYSDITFFSSDLGNGTEIADFLCSLTAGEVIKIPVYVSGNGEYLNCIWNKKRGLPVKTGEVIEIIDKDAPIISPALAALLKPMQSKKDKTKGGEKEEHVEPDLAAILAALQQQKK